MANQYLWISVSVAVFFAGIGIGYGMLQSIYQPQYMMNTQQMMNDPNTMTQWHKIMMSNNTYMDNWMNIMMNDPQSMPVCDESNDVKSTNYVTISQFYDE
ncbi:MAG: hypothetical protein ACREAK_07045 [Nitrosarchaeum sp.]